MHCMSIYFHSTKMMPESFFGSSSNFATDCWESKALVSFIPMTTRETIVNSINFKHIDRHLKSNLSNAVHEFLDFVRII